MTVITGVSNVAMKCRHDFSNWIHIIEYFVVGKTVAFYVFYKVEVVIFIIIGIDEALEFDHGGGGGGGVDLCLLISSCW